MYNSEHTPFPWTWYDSSTDAATMQQHLCTVVRGARYGRRRDSSPLPCRPARPATGRLTRDRSTAVWHTLSRASTVTCCVNG